MKQGRTLSTVLSEVKRQEGMKKDYIVSAPEMRMSNGGSLMTFGNIQSNMTDLFHD